jgi:hypothetical protein
MSGKIGLSVALLAIAVLVVSESQSFGGHHRRRCGSCGSGCATGCAPAACEAAPAKPADASPSDSPPPAPAAPAPAAPAPKGAAKSPAPAAPDGAPAVTEQKQTVTYYTGRRARRGWRR